LPGRARAGQWGWAHGGTPLASRTKAGNGGFAAGLFGVPAISVPCGFDPNGCLIGLQIAGRPFAEARLVKVAEAYQRDTDWRARRLVIM
jgi:Asp-tRNA(Asn)/Glu-tRNA(Gln) amidotransferase A subunit family amidase